MEQSGFTATIPEGIESIGGVVHLHHAAYYSIKLANRTSRKCDASLSIDGQEIANYRIDALQTITVERPLHDPGRFTFYQAGSSEARQVGSQNNHKAGLIEITFMPEHSAPTMQLNAAPLQSGVTGLSGVSNQGFTEVDPLNYDEEAFVTMVLQLQPIPSNSPRPLYAAPPIQSAPSRKKPSLWRNVFGWMFYGLAVLFGLGFMLSFSAGMATFPGFIANLFIVCLLIFFGSLCFGRSKKENQYQPQQHSNAR